MDTLYIIVRFPVFVGLVIAITLFCIPLAILAWLLAPFTQLTKWLYRLCTAPFVLLWAAMTHDKESMESHWGTVEAGPRLLTYYEGIADWLTGTYGSAYRWLVGD